VQIWEKELLPGGEGSLADRRPVCGAVLVTASHSLQVDVHMRKGGGGGSL